MNFWTYNTGYCLFGRMTAISKHTLETMPITQRAEIALRKYERRGWERVLESEDGSCQTWERRCDDRFTWRIQRRPNADFIQMDPAELGSWYMKSPMEDGDIDPYVVKFGVLMGERLEYSYVVSDHDFEHEINSRLRWRYYALDSLHNGGGQCLG